MKSISNFIVFFKREDQSWCLLYEQKGMNKLSLTYFDHSLKEAQCRVYSSSYPNMRSLRCSISMRIWSLTSLLRYMIPLNIIIFIGMALMSLFDRFLLKSVPLRESNLVCKKVQPKINQWSWILGISFIHSFPAFLIENTMGSS